MFKYCDNVKITFTNLRNSFEFGKFNIGLKSARRATAADNGLLPVLGRLD